MSWLPGWNTIAGAHAWEGVFFWGSIIALILLGVMEVASHRAAQRKDELTEQQQTETQNRHDEEMARLHADTEASKAETAKAVAQAAEANRIAEGERLARVKLETQLAGRRLTPEQVKNLSTALQNLNLQIKALKITRLGDQEAHEYATSIAVAVNNSGIYAGLTDVGMMAPPRYGLQVTPNLKPAFDSAGITVDGLISGPEGLIPLPEIFVGLKRPPF